VLSTHRRVTTIFNTADGDVLEIRNTGTPTAAQREVYRALQAKHKPLPIVKRKTLLNKEITQ